MNCKMCGGGMPCYAHGGDVVDGVMRKRFASGGEADKGEIGVHHAASGDAGYEGRSVAGRSVANKTKHGVEDAKKEHKRVLGELKSMKKPHLYSEGGMVANDDEPIVDGELAQYDELAKDDDLSFSYDGANSGDELGDLQEDMDRQDIVDEIMKSRAKKDRMPRPA